jgi:hypothetical protein
LKPTPTTVARLIVITGSKTDTLKQSPSSTPTKKAATAKTSIVIRTPGYVRVGARQVAVAIFGTRNVNAWVPNYLGGNAIQ